MCNHDLPGFYVGAKFFCAQCYEELVDLFKPATTMADVIARPESAYGLVAQFHGATDWLELGYGWWTNEINWQGDEDDWNAEVRKSLVFNYLTSGSKTLAQIADMLECHWVDAVIVIGGLMGKNKIERVNGFDPKEAEYKISEKVAA